MAYDCNEIMCNLGLNSRGDTKKWLLQNHPDKGGEVDSGLFKSVTNCFKDRKYCNTNSNTNSNRDKTQSKRTSMKAIKNASHTKEPSKKLSNSQTRKLRSKVFTCMRQTENWSKMMPHHKLDNNKFDPYKVEHDIHESSPKLEQLFRIIKQLDENDMATHGTYFKHFIFSDVKEQGYGAKIIASAFIANGYNNLLEARKIPNQKALRLSLLDTDPSEKFNSFGMLSSTALFKAEFNQKFKKQVLQTYNKRPDNIQGENMRFIILDSGFKEGIDLFDVKYVHIFEPSMTIADLKQTIGRATRTCGQKGLNFEPNVGWPLYVYNYYIAIPEELKDTYKASNAESLGIAEEDEYLFRNNTKLKDAAMLYSQFDKALTTLSEQLYKLAPIFSVDFALTKHIHRIHDVTYLYDITEQGQYALTGGARGNLKNIESVKCSGKCGLRSTKDIPATVSFLTKIYLKYKHDRKLIPRKKIREFFCNYMKNNPEFCEQINKEWANRAAMVPDLVSKRQSSSPSKKRDTYIEIEPDSETPYLEISEVESQKSKSNISLPKSVSSLTIANEVMQDLQLVPYVAPIDQNEYAIETYIGKKDEGLKQKQVGPPPRRLNFTKMRDFIKTNYTGHKNFVWDEIVIENKCVEPAKAPENKIGGASRIMKLNPTQDFVRTYFTPKSPYKGILLWQSVGTGKTCTAIATATSSFEREGYTILWVTRNTLKNDVYKNMFDDVCHIILAERMKQDGLTIPDDPAQRKRLLSKNWIEPISYKTFSNLLTPGSHNIYLDKLIAKNGKADVLRKTLIIIDEAHKLYGGDLKAAERPNMEVMERLLQNSYNKSGKDSARLLIMTATPFTNSPMELFQLINLCKEESSEHIVTDIREFKELYMDADSMLSESGSKKLADKLSGYISYLNREQDPTQFAQPVMIEVPAIMSHLEDDELRRGIFEFGMEDKDKLNKNKQKMKLKRDMEYIKDLKKRLKETQKNAKDKLKERKARCKTIKNKQEKARCNQEAEEENEREMADTINEIREELETIKRNAGEDKDAMKTTKAKIKGIKQRIKELKDSLIQEVALINRCKNLDLVD